MNQGIGRLFYPDEREWGEVRYTIHETPERITGDLAPLAPSEYPLPFLEFIPGGPGKYAAVRLEDGRWWLAHFKNAKGEALTYGRPVIHPAGPQPKPE